MLMTLDVIEIYKSCFNFVRHDHYHLILCTNLMCLLICVMMCTHTRVHHGRQTHKIGDNFLSDEQVLCIGSSKKRPVLKWEQNTAWPGHLTLTNKALYFEVWVPT
jgi:NADH:ubiquinone oxidoreductase subunit E